MAAETYRIQIPVEVEDKTDPGASNAAKKINAFDKSVHQTQERLDKMNRTKFRVALEAIDKVSAVVGTITGAVKGLAGKAWRVTMSVVDKATAPLRGIINILKNPILQAGAILGVSVGMKDTVDTYSTFEATMSQVKAISGATVEQMTALNAKAKEMGATTKFTASEAGDAFTYMAMAGWKTEDMLSGIEGIMSLAAASGEDLATTSDIVTDALTAFNLTAKESSHFSDVMAAASSNANTNVSLLGESFKYVGTQAGALEYSIEDVSLALGLMANSGLKGSMSGTALATTLTRLATNSNGALDAAEKLGVQFYRSDGSARDLLSVMNDLRDATKTLTTEQKSNFAKTVAGQEAQKGLLAILNASAKDYEKLTEAVYNCEGASQQMADTMLDNLAGSMTLLQSAAEGVKLTIGERLSPYLRRFVTWLTGKMPDIEMAAASAFDFIDEKVKWLTETVNEFMSGEDWANADIWGKIGIAWDKIISEPFSGWWNSTGRSKMNGMMGNLGESIGSGITAGLLALLGMDTGGAVSDGKAIGASFIEGFKSGFDTEQITAALKEWAGNHKGILTTLGIGVGGKLIGGVAKGIGQARGLVGDIQNILGKGGGATSGRYSVSTMKVNAGVVNVYGKSGGRASSAASKVGQATSKGFPALSGGGTLALPGGSGGTLALPGGTAGAAAGGLTSATGWLGQLLQMGSTSSVVGADGTLLAVNGGLGGTLGSVAGSLGSGATTAAGAAAVGAGSILGAIGGLIGVGSGIWDFWKGSKKEGKAAKDDYFSGGTKLGMVGAGAGIGAGIGALFGGVGAAPGALIGAGVGGIASLFQGSAIGKWLSDASDEGGWLNNMGQAISGFFTETLPEKWGEFWDSVGNFFTETVPYAMGFVAGKAAIFFTETLPIKWTEFWDGVGNFFTETIPAWIESNLASAKTFFTETLPEKWNSFWGGIGEKIFGFFGSVGENFSSGYSAATAHADGGIMTKPHMGIVAEAGAESIIPLSPSKRGRGIDLWEQTGQALGVRPYAEGGIAGDAGEEIALHSSGGGVPAKVEIHLEMSPQFVIEAQESGIDENAIVAIIKAHIKEMVDDISDELAERLARVFANMPVRGEA